MDDYQRTIRTLSDRIVLAQTPIRVLDAVKWDDSIRQGFLKAKGKAMPAVDRDYYLGRPLAFDSAAVKSEFQNIERDITRQLGQFNPVGQIMRRMCKEYRMVVRMLEARGTEDFGLISQELYGAASDAFHAGDPTLADLGLMMSDYLDNIDGRGALKDEAKILTAKDAVNLLQSRLNKVFGEAEETIRVFESDGIVADAAAGADFLQVFEFFREQGFEMAESYGNASRVFRGSVPTGLPFTKDLSYLKGFIMVYNYIQLAVRKGKLEQVPLLFCGKTTLEDMRTLRQLVDEGLVVPPKYLPEQFRDMNALSAWMCFSNFLNHLSLDRIEADYSNIL